MSILTTLTDAYFRQDAEGHTVFFPYGRLGNGYVLPDDDVTRRRGILDRMVPSYLATVVLPLLVIDHDAKWLIPLLALAAYGGTLAWLTRGLEPSPLAYADKPEKSVKAA